MVPITPLWVWILFSVSSTSACKINCEKNPIIQMTQCYYIFTDSHPRHIIQSIFVADTKRKHKQCTVSVLQFSYGTVGRLALAATVPCIYISYVPRIDMLTCFYIHLQSVNQSCEYPAKSDSKC